MALPGQIVIDRTQHHRAAQLWCPCKQLVASQPDHPLDTGIQHPMLVVTVTAAGKYHTKKGLLSRATAPQIYADHGLRHEGPGSFLERLAADGIQQRFARLDMAGWLIDDQSPADPLLDKHEATIPFDDGSHSELWPASGPSNIRHVVIPDPHDTLCLVVVFRWRSDAQLAQLPGCFRCCPYFFEKRQIPARYCWLMCIGYTFPASIVDTIEQGGIVSEQKCLAMLSIVVMQVSEFNIGVETSTEPDEPVAVTPGVCGIRDQHTNPCATLGKHQSLDDRQKPFVIVESGLQVGSQDRKAALCNCSDLGRGCTGILKSCQNPAAPLCFFGVHIAILKTLSTPKCQVRHSYGRRENPAQGSLSAA